MSAKPCCFCAKQHGFRLQEESEDRAAWEGAKTPESQYPCGFAGVSKFFQKSILHGRNSKKGILPEKNPQTT
jgi:hypothetical protein